MPKAHETNSLVCRDKGAPVRRITESVIVRPEWLDRIRRYSAVVGISPQSIQFTRLDVASHPFEKGNGLRGESSSDRTPI